MTLYNRLFLNEFTGESRWLEDPYKGPDEDRVQKQWAHNHAWFTQQATARFPPRWVSAPYVHHLDHLDAFAWQWIDYQERIAVQVWHNQTGCLPTQVAPRCEG